MDTSELILWLSATVVALVVLAVLLTAQYWRSVIRQREERQMFKMSQMRFDLDSELKQEKNRQKALEFSQQKEKLASEKQTKRALNKVDLVYNILHDVQAVHQGVDSYLRVVMDSNLALSHTEWEAACSEIKKKSNLLSEMVDCAIELLQYENLADVPCSDDVPINSFCQDMFDACQRYLKTDDIDLSFETSLPDEYTVRTNMGYLRKLLKNLLICSMEYTKQGFIKMIVMEEQNRRRLRFILNDTGTGIPDDVREKLFERLPKDDLKNKIVGVRLRICKALTHLMGGNIYVDETYKEGTSMVFTIAI